MIGTHNDLIDELRSQKASLVRYVQMKIAAGDWHAVQDAASDIREVDAKLDILRELTVLPKDID